MPERRDCALAVSRSVNPIVPMIDQAGFARTGLEVALTTPLDEAPCDR